MLVGVCLYGGFFNAGLGIIILSYLALAGHTDINSMNGLKLVISTIVSLVAIAVFTAGGAIAWRSGIIVLLGSLAGGYLAAHIARRIPQSIVRAFVIIAGTGITIYYFNDIYTL